MILAAFVFLLYSMGGGHTDDSYLRLERIAVRAAQEGDSTQFHLIVDHYKQRIVSLIGRQVGDPAVAEDLAQDVFVRAYRGIKSFRGDAALGTWLVRIAMNVTNSYFSSKAFQQRARSDSFDAAKHDRSLPKDPDDSDDLEGRKAAFREALGHLKPHLRDTLVLCGIEGRSYQEAADTLQIPVGTVRSRLNKARLVLQETLVGKVRRT